MDKTAQLFLMMEHPERYTDEQWSEILADDECRELYTMLSMTRSAVDAQRIEQQASDEEVSREWDRFALANRLHPKESFARRHRIAAAAAIALIAAGIMVAAVQTRFFGLLPDDNPPVDMTPGLEAPAPSWSGDITTDDVTGEPDAKAAAHLYDDVPLEDIIDDLSAHYQVQAEWCNDDVRSLRLYYNWDPDFSLEKVVDMLNSFDAISITLDKDKLIIGQSSGKTTDK